MLQVGLYLLKKPKTYFIALKLNRLNVKETIVYTLITIMEKLLIDTLKLLISKQTESGETNYFLQIAKTNNIKSIQEV